MNLTAGVTIGMCFRSAHGFIRIVSDELWPGDYSTSLTYSQPAVVTTTDDSLNLLLPILAQPIVQKIVDASLLGYVARDLCLPTYEHLSRISSPRVNNVLIKDPAQDSFCK